jgi:ParB/RepB/Spo0J family partition protein
VIGQRVGGGSPDDDRIQQLPLDDVAPSPDNPRRAFDEAALAELAESIKAHGVLEPVLVRPWPALGAAGARRRGLAGHVLIAGERRWRAAGLAGLKHVPAIVKHGLTDEAALRLALIENLQRVDLDPIEEAEGYRRLQQLGMRQREIAAAVHVSQSTVAHRMALVDLPDAVRHKVASGALSASHGEALASLKGFPALQEHLGRLVVEGGSTSAQLEKGAQQGGLLGQYAVQDELQKAGVVRVLSHHEAFDVKTTCAAPGACPFGAYRATAYGTGLCLKPEHYRELAAAAERAQAEEAKAVVAEATAAGAPVPRLDDLPYDSVQRLYHGVAIPEGCSEACPCRATGLTARGEAVPVCTDPDRFQRLERAQKRARKLVRIQDAQDAMDALEARLEGLPEVAGRELALFVAEAVYRATAGRSEGAREALEAAAVRWCPADAAAITAARLWEYDGYERADALAAVEPLRLVRFALWAVLSQELRQRIAYDHGRPGRAEWYLGRGQQPEAST